MDADHPKTGSFLHAETQFVGDADLTEGRLLDGQRNDGIFDLLCDAILQYRLLAADLLQRQLAASAWMAMARASVQASKIVAAFELADT